MIYLTLSGGYWYYLFLFLQMGMIAQQTHAKTVERASTKNMITLVIASQAGKEKTVKLVRI